MAVGKKFFRTRRFNKYKYVFLFNSWELAAMSHPLVLNLSIITDSEEIPVEMQIVVLSWHCYRSIN